MATVIALVASIPAIQASPIPLSPESSSLASETVVQKRSLSAGWNNWSCKPSSAHPYPLVLVHGLTANSFDNWFYMAPRFVAKGYCVFSLSYGQLNDVPIFYGLDKMENSAQQLKEFVDKVLTATNTTQVDLFGHSQGSLMPRYYMKFLNGADKIRKYHSPTSLNWSDASPTVLCAYDKFAAIGAIQYGTTLLGLANLLQPLGLYDSVKDIFDKGCLSCFQFLQNSTFIQNLNAGGDTVPGVQYLMIASKLDEIVTPYTTGFLRDDNPNVHNQVLQNWCSADISEHLAQAIDPIAFNAVHAFFTPTADQTINCADALN
ncbi:hypothetical protein BGZ54_009566 [Gamsiella multidivaricata]|nr:hypothetical protein BGZ54_009566 [Gamsiella multidivaricata]